MPETILAPQTHDPVVSPRWMVIIFNNEVTPFNLVVFTLIQATNCTVDEALIETWEAQHYGKAAVHFATRQVCEEVAVQLESIGVQTSVEKEWGED